MRFILRNWPIWLWKLASPKSTGWPNKTAGDLGQSWCCRSSLKAEYPCPLGNSVFFYYSLQLIGWGPPTCWRLYCLHAQSLSHVWLCNSMDCSLPGVSVHGILQARILEWVAIPSFRGSSLPGLELTSPLAPALQVDSLPLSHQGSPWRLCYIAAVEESIDHEWLNSISTPLSSLRLGVGWKPPPHIPTIGPLVTSPYPQVLSRSHFINISPSVVEEVYFEIIIPQTPLLLFSSVQLLSRVRLFVTPWTTAHQASLSITNSWSLPKLMSIESVMPSNHLILCHPFLLLPSIFPNIRVFSNESALHIMWPKHWSFSFNIRVIALTTQEIPRVWGALCQEWGWKPNIHFLL